MTNTILTAECLRLYYGYEDGKFVLLVTDDTVDSPNIFARVSIRRSDVAKIADHMRFGKKGDTRVIQDHEQLLIPAPPLCERCGLPSASGVIASGSLCAAKCNHCEPPCVCHLPAHHITATVCTNAHDFVCERA